MTTLGQLAKKHGISVEELFSKLYVDSEHYRCIRCGNEEKSSWNPCPKCGGTFCYEELAPVFRTALEARGSTEKKEKGGEEK